MQMPHLVDRVFNRPLLLAESSAMVLGQYLASRANESAPSAASVQVASGMREGRGLYSLNGAVAVVPVEGKLVHKSGYVNAESGVMGYDGIRAAIDAANQDPKVKGILLDVDSPGGEVMGLKALSDYIEKSPKPVWSVANEFMGSAAYWLGASTSRVIATHDAEVGSIGAVWMYMSEARALEEGGISVYVSRSFKNKAKMIGVEEIDADTMAMMDAKVKASSDKFLSYIAKRRKIKTSAIAETNGEMLSAETALQIGLIDDVKSFDETLESFNAFLSRPQGQLVSPSGARSKAMSQEDKQSQAAQAGTGDQDKAAHMAAGAAQERERILGIMKNADGKTATAMALIESGASAEAALAILATVPVAQPAAQAKHDPAKALSQMAAVDPLTSVGATDGKPMTFNDAVKAKLAAQGAAK